MKTDNSYNTGILYLPLFIFLFLFIGIQDISSVQKITFKKDIWKIGSIKEGKKATHNFTFVNTGKKNLKIKKVNTSCGCAAALLSKKTYKPGEKGKIKVTFDTRGYEGKLSKYVYIESNDPKAPRKMLTITASIKVPPRPSIALSKYIIDLGLILEGEESIFEVTIKNGGEKELKVTFDHKDVAFFLGKKRIVSELKIASRKEKKIDIKYSSNKRIGQIREYIMIRSNDPIRPNLSLYISGYIISKKQLKELFDKYKDRLNS